MELKGKCENPRHSPELRELFPSSIQGSLQLTHFGVWAVPIQLGTGWRAAAAAASEIAQNTVHT